MWECSCVVYMSLTFLAAWAVFSTDACRMFPPCLLCVISWVERTYDWCDDDKSLHWILSRASSLLYGCHSPVGGRACTTVVVVEAPRSISEL